MAYRVRFRWQDHLQPDHTRNRIRHIPILSSLISFLVSTMEPRRSPKFMAATWIANEPDPFSQYSYEALVGGPEGPGKRSATTRASRSTDGLAYPFGK